VQRDENAKPNQRQINTSSGSKNSLENRRREEEFQEMRREKRGRKRQGLQTVKNREQVRAHITKSTARGGRELA
jgi:hypothetical protein